MEYWTVTEDSLTEIAERTGTQESYFRKELERATLYNKSLVVFQSKGSWQQLDIDNHYNVPFVMEQLAKRLED